MRVVERVLLMEFLPVTERGGATELLEDVGMKNI